MEEKILISVIIPVYNAEKTLKKCIDSVIDSVIKVTDNYEIICINDGSFDNSKEILDMYKVNSNIIVYNQGNKGVASARNLGLRVAKGKFIAFNDSDDMWLINHVEDLLFLFNKYNDLYCISGNHDIDKQIIPKLSKIEENCYNIKLKNEIFKNYFSPQSSMIRREIVDDGIFFVEGMRYAEEGYFFYKIVKHYRSAYVNKKNSESILHKGRYGDTGLSGNLKEMEKGELSNIKYAKRDLGISFCSFLLATVFSYIKYLKRILISELRKKNE